MHFSIPTKGHNDIVNITGIIEKFISDSKIEDGIVNIFVQGSTAAITIIEHEEGVVCDIQRVLEEIAPEGADYEHHKKWGDKNGAAHVKSALMGPSLTVPIENSKLVLGSWQEIVIIDFDEKPRERKVIVKII